MNLLPSFMRRLLFLLPFLMAAPVAQAQSSAYVELGGSTFGIGVHYERALSERSGLSVGLSVPLLPENSVAVPVHYHLYSKAGPGGFEIAGGGTIATNGDAVLGGPSGYLGYRVQRASGLLFRVGVGVFVYIDEQRRALPVPLPGLSVGKRF